MESLRETIIYLDFESNKAGRCFLAGTLQGSNFQQIFLDSTLAGWAKEQGRVVEDPMVFCETILHTLSEKKAILVAYSEHEKKVIENLVGEKAIDGSYCNLLKAAKKWIRTYRRQEFRELPPLVTSAKKYEKKRQIYALASVSRMTKYTSPGDYAIGKTTSRISAVASGLKRTKGKFSGLTAVQKAKATKVLKHNKFDVYAMQVLYQEI